MSNFTDSDLQDTTQTFTISDIDGFPTFVDICFKTDMMHKTEISIKSIEINEKIVCSGKWACDEISLVSTGIWHRSFVPASASGGLATTGTVTDKDGDSKIEGTWNWPLPSYVSEKSRTSLKSVTIPDSITNIDNNAFCNCTSLESVTMPSSIVSIGTNAFRNCKFLEGITIGNNVISIGDYAFYGCDSLSAVYISDIAAWCNIRFVNSVYYSNPLYYAENLYLNGELVTDLIIPNTVTSIGNIAFVGCKSIKSVTISEGVTSIGAGTFCGCTSLENITIPSSIVSIGKCAFYCCSGLSSVYISDIVAWCNIDFENMIIFFYSSNPLFYAESLYLNGKRVTDLVIPNTVTSIGNRAFCGYKALKSVTITNGVKSIGNYTFYKCTSLESVTIPNSVTSIGGSAFAYCESLKSITIPNSVTSLGNSVFSDCTSLESVTIPNSVTSLGNSVFSDCTSLESVTIPNSVTSLGNSVFSDCTSLESVTIPNSVTSLGNSVFYNCTSLESVTIPSSVTNIGGSVFSCCESLKNVTIPNSITSIGYAAFNDCTSLTDVYYNGTESEWNAISISLNNTCLTNATIHFINPYSATAAVEYAQRYALSYNKEWYFYYNGGDCANYVSQCLFAGGYQMDSEWHCYDNKTYAYWADERGKNTYSWIRADELKDYLVNKGGTLIHNPSASDFSIGDAIFYDWDGDGSMDHSAIVTAIDNGIPKVCCHTTAEKYSKLNANWTLEHKTTCAYLVKLNGNLCYNEKAYSYDIYQIKNTQKVYSSTSLTSTVGTIKVPTTPKTIRGTEISGNYIYTNYIGDWGWINISNATKLGSWSKIEVSHSMGGWYTVKLPTCTASGLQLNVCSKCGYTQQRTISRLDHNYASATCTKASYCIACGTTTGSALGHSWDSGVVTKEPNCTETGVTKNTCTRCGITKTSTIAAKGHTWGDYVTTTEPSCTTLGVSTSTCSVCKITRTKDIDALGHDTIDTIIYPTCSADGYTLVKCKRDGCNYSATKDDTFATGHALSPLDDGYSDSDDKMELISSVTNVCGNGTIDTYQCTHIDKNTKTRCTYAVVVGSAQDHNMGDWYTETHATCTTKGLSVSECQNNDCTYRETKEIDALGHDLPKSWTDNNDGTHVKECKRDNCSYKESEDCIFGEWTTISEATCTEVGEMQRECTICGYTESKILDAVGHNYGRWTDNGDGTHIKVCANDESHIESVEHQFKEISVTTPTCTDDGMIEYECEICSAVVQKVIDATDHDYSLSEEMSKKPTCTEDGYNYFVCANNNEHYYKKTITASGHNMGEWVDYPPENGCGEGKKVRECQNDGCDYFEEDYYVIDHNYGDEIIVEATCVTQGYTYTECENCGYCIYYKYTDENPDNHADYDTYLDGAYEPKCTETGSKDNTYCAACDALLQNGNTIPALGHDYGSWVDDKNGTTHTKTCQRDICNDTVTEHKVSANHKMSETERVPAKCTVDGYVKYDCSDCDYTYTEPLKATGHDYGKWIKNDDGTHTKTCSKDSSHTVTADCNFGEWETTLEPKCTEKGEKERTCTDCGYVEKDEVPAKDHDWNDGVINPSSTCNTHGTKTYTCKNDSSHTYTEEVPLDPRNHVGKTYLKDNKAPKCTEDGYTGDTYCSDCDALLQKGEPISALGHDYGSWVDDKNGTTHTKTCQRDICNDTVTEHKVSANHKMSETERVPAKCTVDGYVKYDCSDCDYTYTEPLKATGHDYGKWIKNNDGTHTKTCSKDSSHTVTADCNFGEWETTLEPKCTEKGEKERTCTDCGYVEKDEVPAKDHDWGEWKVTKEPTYDETGIKKQICRNDSSHIKEEIIPVLTRESEENDNVKTDKTVDYNELTGEAVIRLTASSNGEKIVTKSRIPLDIVLVLDQSGSMEGRPNTELKKAATTFVNSIYADAVDNNLDHRVAMVGFAMQNQGNYSSDYHQYLNTEVLSTGSDPIEYGKATNATYKNALVSVNKDNKLNPVLTTAIGNIAAKGATATDLGLDMACKIFSQNENDGTRKRIVVLMSDGVPTYSDANKREDVEEATNNAKFNAELLKNTYNADVYSVGLLSGLSDDVIRYGEYVTYGKQYGKSFLENIASKNSDGKPLYYDCNDADALVTNFNKIAEESTIIRSDFDDVTLIDTVSNAFTLTSKQENQLRMNAIKNLGVTNEDITITRFDDGTTQVKIQHISPKKVEQANGVKFVIDFSFNVTANENALVADSYVTNTDNAGVIVGVKDVYENNFAAPSDNVEEAQGVIYFNINGITYHVLRVHAGDKIEQPEINLEGGYTFSGWDLPDEITFEGGKYTVDATLTQDAYTVTWVVDGENIVDSYHCGDIISVPKVVANSQGDEFTSWDGEIPSTMPARNLVFTAVYTKHVHQWVASTASSDKNETAYSNVYCKNCGASPDNSLSYTLTATSGRKTYTYNLKLVDAQNITIDVDGNITISLPIPSEMRYARNITVSRREADGTLTVLDAVKNGNYVTFTTDHFSEYILSAAYDCDETGKHIDNNCDTYCDTCGVSYSNLGHSYDVLSKTTVTCTKDGYTTYKCSKCGNTYDGDKVTAPGHKDADGDGNCDTCGQNLESIVDSCDHLCHSTSGFMKFLWKIAKFFYKLFGTNKYCSCGVKHW